MRARRVVLGLLAGLMVAVWAAGAQEVEVLFFYEEGCSHCKQVETFLGTLVQGGLPFKLQRYGIHTPEGWSLLQRLLTAYGAELGPVPMVFVGDVVMVGTTFYGVGPQPVTLSGLAQELTLEEAIRTAQAMGAPSPLTKLPPTVTEGVLFTRADGCPDCRILEALVERWVEQYPGLGVRQLDLATADAASTFDKLKRMYGADGNAPGFFAGDVAVVGGQVFLPRRAPVALDTADGTAAVNDALAQAVRTGASSPLDRLRVREQLTLGAVIVAAALDSVNPCDFAVLLLLLGTLLVVGKRVKVIWAGLAFAAGIFVAYYTIGFALYSLVGGIRAFRVPFVYAVSALAIVIGLWEMKDLLWYGKWFSIEVPEKWKPFVKKLTASVVSIPGAFVIGLVDSLFLAPCTSGPYIVILTLLSQTTSRLQGALWLLLYNFIFILPMIGITLLVHLGFTTTARAERWRTAKLGKLHFTTGLVMVVIGVGMIVGVRLGYL
ncbi:cytochrome c biogenesis protein CcdA [Candidatus Bipolaricaulota bacterium]|nr:cytochrome c biogenesis protein CcdA [Candidatus Bipolaricaulota bacterium]